jgi:hypothetical protein
MAPVPAELLIDAVPHPDPAVRQVGFPADDPYVEHVWSAVLGPSATLLLRRLPELWRHSMPATVEVAELAASLGLGRAVDGSQSRIWRAFHRLAAARLATPIEDGCVGVVAQVPPLSGGQLARMPGWTVDAHDRLLAVHLERLAEGSGRRTRQALAEPVARLTARLDQLEHREGPASVPGPAR